MAVLLEEAIEQLRERIEAGAPRIAIQAPPGFGKTTVLRGLAASLAGRRRIVRIGLPEGDDAALVALVEAAAQLDGGTPALLERVVPRHEPARVAWADRIAAVREALSCAGDDLLLLVDGPRFQTTPGAESELFARRAVELTETLLAARAGTLVLAGSWVPDGIAEDAGFRLPLVRDPFMARAHDASDRLGRGLPHVPPPVVQQVLRALEAAGVDVERIPAHDLRLDRLVPRLGRALSESPEGRRVIARLAALRVPFSDSLLERAGFMALPPRTRSVVGPLVEVLDDGSRLVPEALARQTRALLLAGHPDWRLDGHQSDAHHLAAAYHRERFQAARERGDVGAAVREELEEIYQLTEAGDAAALLSRSLQFVEQYDALGKSLSQKALRAPREQEEKLRRDAVRAYERAVEHDERDAYAHHYIAYNLDILGTEPERVEREYVKARDLAPGHSWYHGRYVCFLVTRVWMKEARAAWEQALNDLAATGPLQAQVYEALHGQAARLLLSRGRLDFAAEVLEDVPRELRASWWQALDQLCVCLEEDRDERLVFPPTLPLAMRWKGPHLADEREVHAWKPGRVFGRDEQVVLLLVADHPDTVSTLCLSKGDLGEVWNASPSQLRVGTFVELIEYADGTRAMEIWDRLSSSFEAVPGLPKLFPSPDRYVRRAFA
ncbi:hypothetical protein BE04_51055 [Sorangium cellulosum]|uniref:Uncharacterized protein n=1 Tax=Sorangium cellulosum TaxID=56 RepID=A0A150P2G7_SORCE|nr:hypothetical protein BE04_51055 [Sorangium cellulosum]